MMNKNTVLTYGQQVVDHMEQFKNVSYGALTSYNYYTEKQPNETVFYKVLDVKADLKDIHMLSGSIVVQAFVKQWGASDKTAVPYVLEYTFNLDVTGQTVKQASDMVHIYVANQLKAKFDTRLSQPA